MLFAKCWFGPGDAGVLGNRTSKGTEVRGEDLFKKPKVVPFGWNGEWRNMKMEKNSRVRSSTKLRSLEFLKAQRT